MMLGSAIPDILNSEVAVKGMHEGLGYPIYFIPFIGFAKLLGVIALLAPINHRIKEWAYAGFFFDLIGATFSIYASGKTGPELGFMLLPIALFLLSYLYFRKKQYARTGTFNFALFA
jgi:hypothetical protein